MLLLAASLSASQAVLTMLFSDPAFAGNGKGGGNGGGNGGGGGKGGGSGGGSGGGNSGGSGGGNSGGNGNGPGSNNAGGNGKGKGAGASNSGAPDSGVQANSALGLREAGVIRPLEDVYKVAEEQLKGRVLDAELVGSNLHGWNYDLRVVTEDGHVRKARYDAATLSLQALDGQPIE